MSCSDCSAIMIWVWLVMLWVLYGQNMGSWYGSRRVLTRFVGDFLIISCSDCRSVMIWVWLVMVPVLFSQDMDTPWLCYDWYGFRKVGTGEIVVSWCHAVTEVQSWWVSLVMMWVLFSCFVDSVCWYGRSEALVFHPYVVDASWYWVLSTHVMQISYQNMDAMGLWWPISWYG